MDRVGDALSITLGNDPNTNKLAIIGDSVNLPTDLAKCKPATTQTVLGYGTGFLQDLDGPTATLTFNFPDTYTVTNMTFSGNKVTGNIVTYESLFVGVASGRPKKASFCSVPKEKFTLTLNAGMPAGARFNAHLRQLTQ